MRREARLFLVAVQFLTRLPVPELPGFQPSWLAQSARYFPAVGALVGYLNVGVWWLAKQWLPAAVAVGVMLAASMLITGAFHEDGFADTCDGMGGGASSARVLEIMKDSRLGTYGAAGLFMMLGLKWATLLALPAAAFLPLVVIAHMLSRWCSSGLIWTMRYVRLEGAAAAKPLADTLSAGGWLASGLLGLAGVLPLFAVPRLAQPLEWRVLAPAGAAAALSTLAAAAYFRRRIGGYTGDCLGAAQQIAELAFLMAGLAALAPARRG